MPLHALLLEDDPGIQSFVTLALEDMPVVLHCCASLQAARALLRERKPSLVLADMHLPDGNGLELLTQLCQHNQPPYCIVFSGDIAPALERQLLQQGVRRVLHKPVSVATLRDSVHTALASLNHGATLASDTDSDMASDTAPASAAPPPPPDPVATYFGGNHSLYAAWRSACLAQLPADLAAAQAALASGDSATLRRLAHNLKSALAMLGQPQSAELARQLEQQAEEGHSTSLRTDWQRLRQQVLPLCS